MYRVELKAERGKGLPKSTAPVPNVPCGVESKTANIYLTNCWQCVLNVPCGVESPFLLLLLLPIPKPVPNVPCGVERRRNPRRTPRLCKLVPNVPCGVERHYVDLEDLILKAVPNVPCGVESPDKKKQYKLAPGREFLMYRVELKETS